MIPFNLVPLAIIAAAVVALFVAWQGDRAVQRSKGASVAIEKVKDNNAKVARKADAAARRSADDGAPGLPNPNYRD